MLEAINLSKTYSSDGADYDVLKNVNLRIGRGECAAIIGKSGSGKSTLMHLLACLDVPTSGVVHFEGADFTALSEREKDALRNEKFGFVFQQFFLNGHDTVFENVVLPLRIRGAENYDLVKNAMNALEAVGLKDKEAKRAKDLSGGEKQRVCIARALVTEPSVIFADEPTGNLDSNTSAVIEEMLFRLNKEKGITLIVVTHDDDLAAKCERVIELKDGEIISDRRRNENSLNAAADVFSPKAEAAPALLV
jgi:putative ABC transport system ATP-binding protein